MAKQNDVKPLPKDMLRIGIPLQHAVYDAEGHLLMQAGVVIESQNQLDKLYERGLYMQSRSQETGARTRGNDAAGTMASDASAEPDPHSTETLVQLSNRSLKLGETLQIKPLADETGNTQYFVKYIGGVEKKSLICTVPTQDDKVVFIKENSGFSVRLFSGKNVYTFNTMVDVVFSRPYPHMHFKFPREVYANKLRRNQRVAVSVIAAMTNRSEGERVNAKISGRIIDLSMGGAMVESFKTAGEIGETIECSFKLSMEGGEALFVIPGILRNVLTSKQENGQNMYRHGIQFTEIVFQEKLVLQNFIFQTLTGEKMDEL